MEPFLAESPFHSSMHWAELNVSAYKQAPCGHEVLPAVTSALDRFTVWPLEHMWLARADSATFPFWCLRCCVDVQRSEGPSES